MAKEKKQQDTTVVVNKKAYHDYDIVDTIEAGISLTGSEVKSLRLSHADLKGSYARIVDGQCYLIGSKIEQYKEATYNNHEPGRKRKLLLHRAQIKKLTTKLAQRGYTLVPLKIYFNERGIAKLLLALAQGKKLHDKRTTIQDRDQKRDMQRSIKNYR